MATLEDVWNQFQAWPLARRATFVATAIGSVAFFLWIGYGASARPYALLYRGLPADEMAEVVRGLEAERMPYRLTEGGGSVEVPSDQVYAARIHLAGQGLPRGGGAGFELFDRSDFGVTDFVHRVNYRRALQGELARSIAELEPVSRARVQIAIPERSAFVGAKDRQPSASVVVDLRPGTELSPVQVRGIVHLVSAAVESLPIERVSIVDGRGRLLAPIGESTDPAQPTGTGNYQERMESELAGRIESILGHTVGAGRVAARVRADLDWTQTESTEERFDPDSQVARSEERSTQTDEDAAAATNASGGPGVATNVPSGGAPGAAATSNENGNARRSARSSENTAYEISKTVLRSVGASGTVKRLTVAILLDGKPDAKDGAFEAWDEKSIAQFEELAKRAVGFDAARGDQLTVTNAPFRALDAEEEADPMLGPGVLTLLGAGLRGVLLLASLIAFGLLVVRPLAATLASAPATVLPARVVDLEAQLAGAGARSSERVASGGQPAAMAADRIDDTVEAIRAWLRQS